MEIPRPWLKNYKLEAKGRKTKNTSGMMFEKQQEKMVKNLDSLLLVYNSQSRVEASFDRSRGNCDIYLGK